MKNYKNLFLTGLLIAVTCLKSFAQDPKRIVGYFAYYEQANRIQWNKITDLNYAFAVAGNDGTVTIQGWQFANVVTTANQNNVDMWIAIGGANQSTGYAEISKSQVAMDKFANEIKAILDQYNLAGVDLDWEFPEAHQEAGMLQMVKTIRQVIGNNRKISIAATPLSFNAAGLSKELEPYVDYYNIMAYDNSDAANHSDMDFARDAIEYWVNKTSGKGVPREKLVLGVPFYGKSQWSDVFYRDIPDAYANVDEYNGFGYNGIPTIKEKANLTLEEGLNGIMIWEIAQDKLNEFSLLTAINDIYDNKERCKLPDLGSNKTLCGVPSVNLETSITGNYGFSWTKDNGSFSGSSSSNLVSEQGEYCVTVKDNSGSCLDKSSCVQVRGAADIQIENGERCGAGTVDLSVVSGGEYEWFNNETGGTSFHSGRNYTTASISSDQTYYVQKKPQSGVVGESSETPFGWYHDYTTADKGHYMHFEALQDIIITGGSLYIGLVEEDVTFTVYGPDTVTVIAEQTFPVLEIDETQNGRVDYDLELHIPKGESYFLSMHKSTNTRVYLDNQKPGAGITYDYPYTLAGLFEAKSHIAPWAPDNFMYVGVYDIKVESEPGCGRVAVEAVVKTGCVLPDLTIVKPTQNQDFSDENVMIEADVTDADGTITKVVASIIDKSNFQTIATINLTGSNGLYTGEWEPEDKGSYVVEIVATDNDGNKTTKQVDITVSSVVSVNEFTMTSELFLNSDQSILNIPQNGNFEIYNISGKIVLQGFAYSNTVKVGSLSTGTYVVRMDQQMGRFVKK